jgi:serine O-acetyltransferase
VKFKDTIYLIKSDLSKLGAFQDKKINFIRILFGFLGSKGAQAAILYRLSHYFGKKSNLLGNLITNYSVRTTGCEIKHGATIGKGLRICHTVGIVISDSTFIGENCMIYQGVTIGKRTNETVNHIGNDVQIAAGAKVFADNIGSNVKIGANSVVTKDVPDNCFVAGVPAKVISTRELKVAK